MSDFPFFAGITPDGRLDIGANRPIDPSPEMAARIGALAAGRSAAITFVEDTAGTTPSTPDEADTEEAIVRELLGRMEQMMADATPVRVTVGDISDTKMVSLVPEPEWMRHPAFRYVLRYKVLSAMTRKRLIRPGDTFTARVTGCMLPYVALNCTAADTHPGEDISDVEAELMAQPYATFLQCAPAGEKQVFTDRSGKEREATPVSAYGLQSAFSITEESRPCALPDGSMVCRLTRSSNHPLLDNSCGTTKDLPYSPPEGRAVSTAVGTVHSFYNTGNNLMQVIFDGGTDHAWRSGVFVKHPDGQWSLPFPVIDAARLYIRMGYPCRFVVEINPRDNTKSKLLLTGLSPRLEGRVPHTINTRRILPDTPIPAHDMAPAAACDGFIYMQSADCTALMPVEKAPLPLRLMAGHGIFSPDFTINCQPAIIRLPGYDIRLRLTAMPTGTNVYQALPAGSEPADVRICCSAGERLILMADGLPAMSTELPHETRLGLLRGGIRPRWTVDRPCDGDTSWLQLHFAGIDGRDTDLRLGAIFELGRDSTYRHRPVLAVPEGEPRPEGTIMMALGSDSATGSIVATDELARYTDAPGSGIDRMRLHTGLLRYGTVVAECADGRLTAYSTRSPLERTIFKRLASIYGPATTALMHRDGSYMRIGCSWTGVACQHDYTAILGNIAPEVAELWDGLSDDTPVLFGDVPLTRADLLALPAAQARDMAQQQAGEEIPHTTTATLASVDVQADTATFYLGGTRFVKDMPRTSLRLPVPRTQRKRLETLPLDEIFTPGSQWLLDMSDPDDPRIHAHTDTRPRPYTLVARLNNDEWVIRSDDGSIALTDSVDDGREGMRILAVHGSLDGSVAYAELSDDNFVGRKMHLRVVGIEGNSVVCSDISGQIQRRIELPLDRVSWNPDWRPTLLGAGTVLKACVVEVEADRVIVDRRMLLHQDALYAGIAPEPGRVYQMEVAGVEDRGYRLTQNGVELLLPFDKAAIFDITIFNDSALRTGDLVAVRTEADGITADGLSMHLDEIAELDKDPDDSYAFSVHHHCPDGIFLERRRIMAFLPNRQLGRWAGVALETEYPAGFILDLLIVRSPDTGTLEASLRNPQPLRPKAPAEGSRHRATVAHIYPGHGFYAVTADGLPVYVECADPVEPGMPVAVGIISANASSGLIMGQLL